MCGQGIPRDDFLFQNEKPGTKYALCGHCGVPNSEDDTAFVAQERPSRYELPPPVTDVYPVEGGGWRATCDCGQTEAAETQAAGWDWVLDHECIPLI
jgi:hypothetical protein